MRHYDPDPNRPNLAREMWVYEGPEVNAENLQLGFADGLRLFIRGPDVLLRIQLVPDVSAPKQQINRYKQRDLDPDEQEEVEGDEDAEGFSIFVSQRLELDPLIRQVSTQHIVYPPIERTVERWLGWDRGTVAGVLSIAIAEAK